MPDIVDKTNGLVVRTEPIIYVDLVPPRGFLTRDPACNALMYYAMLVAKELEQLNDPIKIEGKSRIKPNFRQLFLSIATMYGVHPQQMVAFWRNVDMTFDLAFGDKPIKRVPEEYRFGRVPEIKTQ